MELIKPKVDNSDVVQVFNQYTSFSIDGIYQLTSGQMSSTFECTAGNEIYIVQFNEPNMAYGVIKERFLANRMKSVNVPLREVVSGGEYKDLIYTIAKKANGTRLTALPPSEFKSVLPEVLEILILLSSVDLNGTEGYGYFNEFGIAPDESWYVHMSKIGNEEPGEFFGNWHEMFTTTFLDRDKFDTYFNKMLKHLDAIDAPRSLVHGSFGYDNVLIESGKVSVVLDWQDARFGDHLFDLAYLDYWLSDYGIVSTYLDCCKKYGVNHPSFKERVLACKYYNTLSSMLFFAKTNNINAYNSVINIADHLE